MTAAGLVLSTGSASSQAADGPAPPSTQRTVVADVHTDAIATFWEDGELRLASRADTPAPGTRYDADEVWFHVDDDSRVASWPGTGPEFVAPQGSTVWLAPQDQGPGQLWPGFSTESVPAGTLDENATTLSLLDVTGPGDVEIWQSGMGGAVTERLWSSDEPAHRAFTRPRTHLHANWAFTAPGVYELTVRADAAVAGQPVSDTAVYTFVVGDLPEQVLTSTSLTASVTELSAGDPVELTARVSPAGIEGIAGAVEFRNGATVLGHDPVDETGIAQLTVPALAVGAHALTAAFVPTTTNLATASTSSPVTVTVTDASGEPFAVTGIEAAYQPGDTLTATLSGYTLADGEQVRWRIRSQGSTSANGATLATAASTTYTTVLGASDDGYEISAQVRQGTTPVATTGWVPITVTPEGTGPSLAINTATPAPFFTGDTVVLDHPGTGLADGESLEVVTRTSATRWAVLNATFTNVAVGETQSSFRVRNPAEREFAVRVVRDGVPVRQSAPVALTIRFYEVHIEDVRSLYRVGETLSATGRYFPVRDGVDDVTYTWRWTPPGGSATVIAEGIGTPPTPVLRELSLADDGARLGLAVTRPDGSSSGASTTINVTEQTGQLFELPSLLAHYHQNDPIDLRLAIDPALAEGDQITWEWKWPGAESDWEPFPGIAAAGEQINSEQALDGVQVRARLTFADQAQESMIAGPVTIAVDDHGAPARQLPSVAGASAGYTAGESLALRLELPGNGPTILTGHRWERKAAGAQEWAVLEGQSGKELALPARPSDDGASYRVSILKPTGEVAYGPSEPVTVSVTDETATELGIAGIDASYQVGDVLRARVVGHELTEEQSWRWIIRPVGATTGGYVLYGDGDSTEASQGRLRQLLDVRHDGYEIRARLRQGTAYVTGKDTAWVPLRVENAVAPVTTAFPQGMQYLGDDLVFPLDGPEPAAGESARLVYRSGSPWFDVPGTQRVDDTIVARPPYPMGASEFAVQTLRDGVVVAMSTPVTGEVKAREVLVQGVRGVYRVGQSLTATAEVYPPREGLTYRWFTVDGSETTTLKEGPDALSIELPMTMDWHDKPLHFVAVAEANGAGPLYGDEIWAAQWSTTVKVSDADPGTQLLFFENLSQHYHQGYDIDLNLVADPEIDAGDTLVWEWKWPGADWVPFPGASGLSHHLIAEQALAGVEVRARLEYGDSDETLVTDPVTIQHDDHGGAPRQQPTVGGATSYTAGNLVTLTRELPENGATVLTEHRWEKRVAGAEEWTTVEDETGAELSFPADAADDGTQYRVSLLKPGGAVGYGPSPAVTLAVGPGEDPGPEPVATATSALVSPSRQVYGKPTRLRVRLTPNATGSVVVDLPGSTPQQAELSDGEATVLLPAKALMPGTHRLTVRYTGVPGRFAPSQATARVRIVKADARLRVIRLEPTVRRGRTAAVRVQVRASGIRPSGTVTLRVGSRTVTVPVNARGRAVVRIKIPRTAGLGRRSIAVRYADDPLLRGVKVTRSIRVTR
ncbi:choice-of-anchor M domain-containing protein [Nocardioides carbamazepini]|uniref:choice-of-anchor M domain-containing protein n=1 Tax=Nocardioides carbamazepini TaxID=2854259 RepID=UPI00214A5808|nr:choice-of-anchor M domain-containing protein [Nocardioides carbamazepini]MCR1785862.1 choice-of-anchor M domain-containing protein [Nocardioides carbamazepini]